MLDTIFASISEAVVNYDFPKVYKLVQHDISLTCKYQGPHSPVKLPPYCKRILLIFPNPTLINPNPTNQIKALKCTAVL